MKIKTLLHTEDGKLLHDSNGMVVGTDNLQHEISKSYEEDRLIKAHIEAENVLEITVNNSDNINFEELSRQIKDGGYDCAKVDIKLNLDRTNERFRKEAENYPDISARAILCAYDLNPDFAKQNERMADFMKRISDNDRITESITVFPAYKKDDILKGFEPVDFDITNNIIELESETQAVLYNSKALYDRTNLEARTGKEAGDIESRTLLTKLHDNSYQLHIYAGGFDEQVPLTARENAVIETALDIAKFKEALADKQNKAFINEITGNETVSEIDFSKPFDVNELKTAEPHDREAFTVELLRIDKYELYMRTDLAHDKDITPYKAFTDPQFNVALKYNEEQGLMAQLIKTNDDKSSFTIKETFVPLKESERDTLEANFKNAMNEYKAERNIGMELDFKDKVDENEQVIDKDGNINAVLFLEDDEVAELYNRSNLEEQLNMSFDDIVNYSNTFLAVGITNKDSDEIKAYIQAYDDNDGFSEMSIVPLTPKEYESLVEDVGRAIQAKDDYETELDDVDVEY